MYTVGSEGITADYKETAPFKEFVNKMELRIISLQERELEFDLINCNASIANAIRRIMIAEVPSMAIDDVEIRENTTIMPDEYLAHRLGLIPIIVSDKLKENNEIKSIRFKLKVKNETKEIKSVYSGEIEIMGQHGEATRLKYQEKLVELQKDVLICKMAPGYSLDMEFTARWSVGAEHAKWSPVSLCSYRLLPKIQLLREFKGDEAEELRRCFSQGVIEIKEGRAVVANARLDSMSREVFRHPNLRDGLVIQREPNWFCFTVETISADPIIVLKKAIQKFKENCSVLKKAISEVS